MKIFNLQEELNRDNKMGNNTSNKVKNRSEFMRYIIQRSNDNDYVPSDKLNKIPKHIVQYWNNMEQIPQDVLACIESWKTLEEIGIRRTIFDKKQAIEYIRVNYSDRHLEAFNRCYHPAMESDFFRLCYILLEGGCYIDADDVYNGKKIEYLFNDARLKIQPLCYDNKTNSMVSPQLFTKLNEVSPGWIFYFNNNPLFATSGNKMIYHALERATSILLGQANNSYPEIQSTTGPGNITETIYRLTKNDPDLINSILILKNWEDIAISKWPLSYRNDSRNWRHSNTLPFQS
jgi:hypothetical protein